VSWYLQRQIMALIGQITISWHALQSAAGPWGYGGNPGPEEAPADSRGAGPTYHAGESSRLIGFTTEMTSEEIVVLQLYRQLFQKRALIWGSSTVTAPTKAP